MMNIVFARTYTVGSGKWNDARIWNGDYAGSTINAGDIVHITGQVVISENVSINGVLQIDKGASIVGIKNLVITKSGFMLNNGTVVVKKIINGGTIYNNQMMEASADIDNWGVIENNNSMVAGNNFDIHAGNAGGVGGAYYVNNNINSVSSSAIGKNVDAFYGNAIDSLNDMGESVLPDAPALTANYLQH